MKTADFDYFLPEELIAKYPLEKRRDSKLLIFDQNIEHNHFSNITNYFNNGDLLVLNNTSVIPARIFGKKESGGSIEVMLERILENNRAMVQIRSGRAPKIGSKLILGKFLVECIERKDNFFILQFNQAPLNVFNSIGHVPLPPYIKRPDKSIDKERYGTVYQDKNQQNSVAAPTAGLHFDKNLLDAIKELGVNIVNVNLSVGAGTFQPVKAQNIKDHIIHNEYMEVSSEVIEMILKTKKNGHKVFAVGTTAARSIETVFQQDNVRGYKGYTSLFIYPGYKFKVVDMLITNFHLPKSSLLMLVAAFIGFKNMKNIYKIGVEKKYRFLSYGDAMLLKYYEI